VGNQAEHRLRHLVVPDEIFFRVKRVALEDRTSVQAATAALLTLGLKARGKDVS